MKKRVLIFIPILVVLVLVVTLLLLNNRQTPAWKAKLNQYLSYLRETGKSSYLVLSTAYASQPANFTPAMSAESYSDSVIFQTTHNTNAQYSSGLEPMPYPPDEVVCVLLKDGGQQQLVYIALHNSLYNADWIVHISPDPWGSFALQSNLDRLGCSLDT